MNRINRSLDDGQQMDTAPNYYVFQETSIGHSHQHALTTAAHPAHHAWCATQPPPHRSGPAAADMPFAWPSTSLYDHRSPPMQQFDGAATIGGANFDCVLEKDMQQFPSIEDFEAIVQGYLDNLSSKKRDKALVDRHRYSLIVRVLKDPRNTAISTAQFRFWVKKMFQLVMLQPGHDVVCHDSKPVAMREDIYGILVRAHKQANHGGRDKTSALVRRRHSWIPKELIARFVRHCPYCIARRIGSQSPPIGLLPRTPPDERSDTPTDHHRGRHSDAQHPLTELSYLPVSDKDLGIDWNAAAAAPPLPCYSPTTTSPSSSISGPSSVGQHQHQGLSTTSNCMYQQQQQQPSMLLSPCGIPSAPLDAPPHVDHHPPSFNMCYHAASADNHMLGFSSNPTASTTPPESTSSQPMPQHARYAHGPLTQSYYYAHHPYMTSRGPSSKDIANTTSDAPTSGIAVSSSSPPRHLAALYDPNASNVMIAQQPAPAPPPLRNL